MLRLRKRVLWTLIVLLIVSLPAIALIAPRLKKKPQPTGSQPSIEKTAILNNTKERVEGEIIEVTPHGFEPSQISRPHKHFILVFDNHSGVSQVELRLDREHGARLREISLPRGKRTWSDDLDLSPGRYVLTEANHPSWRCDINIASN
jgi:hypothetical protein